RIGCRVIPVVYVAITCGDRAVAETISEGADQAAATRPADNGVIITRANSEGSARANVGYAADAPAAHDLRERSVIEIAAATAKGQLVDVARHEAMPHVEITEAAPLAQHVGGILSEAARATRREVLLRFVN